MFGGATERFRKARLSVSHSLSPLLLCHVVPLSPCPRHDHDRVSKWRVVLAPGSVDELPIQCLNLSGSLPVLRPAPCARCPKPETSDELLERPPKTASRWWALSLFRFPPLARAPGGGSPPSSLWCTATVGGGTSRIGTQSDQNVKEHSRTTVQALDRGRLESALGLGMRMVEQFV